MILEMILYYWPRVLLGIWYAGANTIASKRGGKFTLLLRFIILLLISGPVIAIADEYISESLYVTYILPHISVTDPDALIGIALIYHLIFDALSMVIPIYIFSKIIGKSMTVAATAYFVFVILDRLCLILSISALSYFIIVSVIASSVYLFTRESMLFIIDHSMEVEWQPVFHYQMGLFFLLDALYSAYYVFPGIESGVYDLRNLWIDSLALVSFVFFVGFARINIRVTKEQTAKMRYMERLQEGERDIIQKFAEISEAKSGETGQHVRRVAEYSALLAKEYGLSKDDVEHIRIASMMHDVGKLLVPREIIEKPGQLTDEEVDIMRMHTEYGDDILANSNGEVIAMAREIASQHHERWDGQGYPKGIKGEKISIYAQIVAVADVYDALTSKRSYKEPWSSEEARKEIIAERGTQFAPRVVDTFRESFDKILEIQQKYVD
jgi:hypothetical protein